MKYKYKILEKHKKNTWERFCGFFRFNPWDSYVIVEINGEYKIRVDFDYDYILADLRIKRKVGEFLNLYKPKKILSVFDKLEVGKVFEHEIKGE